MKNNYVEPQVEVIKVEIEDAILSGSGVENYLSGTDWGDFSEFEF